jgi:hypothetical protein
MAEFPVTVHFTAQPQLVDVNLMPCHQGAPGIDRQAMTV